MALESIRMSAVIPGSAADIYAAWLDGDRHAEFTGGAASVEARVGGRHTAWDGYIAGEILVLEPGRRIVQSWRSLDFPLGSVDSRLEVVLAPAPNGTEITLIHSEIPEGQSGDYEEGWLEYYFKPMQQYFRNGGQPTRAPAPRTAPVAVAAVKQAPPARRAAPPAKKSAAPAKKQAAPAKKKAAPAKKKAAPAKKKAAPAKKKAAPAKKRTPSRAPAGNKSASKKSGKKR